MVRWPCAWVDTNAHLHGLTQPSLHCYRHQDYSYWVRTRPMNHMVCGVATACTCLISLVTHSRVLVRWQTVHIALDDQTEENGGLVRVWWPSCA